MENSVERVENSLNISEIKLFKTIFQQKKSFFGILTQDMENKMKLEKILDALYSEDLISGIDEKAREIEVLSVGCDSRSVTKGQLFFIKGANFKEEYLNSAIEKGCVAVIGEEDKNISVPYIKVSDIRKTMPICAKVFYANPSEAYSLVGITGTKGKTTCTYMLKNVFEEEFGDKVGIISTVEALSKGRKISKSGTTPEALELYSILNEFKKDKVSAACMEVSSQGLAYNRVDGIKFKVGAFLNLGEDHISPTEHHSFEEYKEAKKRLLSLCENGIVNIDDAYGEEFKKASKCKRVVTVGIEKDCDVRATDIKESKEGISFKVKGELFDGKDFKIIIPGRFNVYNALVSIVSAYFCGCSYESIRTGLERTVVDGRMEIIEKKGVTVIVDYAHNGLSFEAVFGHVEKFYPDSKVICLFGCQGNKALDRRIQLPEVVGKHADFAVITSDDPENEEPSAILEEVGHEMEKTSVPFVKIEDREKAVTFAIDRAEKGDVVFLSGKGPETTQKVRGKIVPYKGDMQSALEALEIKK